MPLYTRLAAILVSMFLLIVGVGRLIEYLGTLDSTLRFWCRAPLPYLVGCLPAIVLAVLTWRWVEDRTDTGQGPH